MQTAALKALHTHRDLLTSWTLRTIRARYQQSILGGLWAILQPAAPVAIFTIVFTYFVPVDTGDVPYVIFSYTAMVPWLLFSASLSDMTECLVVNMNLISKIYFPREILVIAAMLARLLDFGIAFGVLLLLMILFGMPLFGVSWLLLPVILATQLTLSLGLGLLSTAANVFYRDIRHLVVLGLQLWFYATPIIYPVALVPERFRSLYLLFNPMAGVIEAYRAVLLNNAPPEPSLYTSALVSLSVMIAGYWFFKRLEPQFADVV
jgi:lipopolysaccharide transport system permease protein